MLIGGVKMNGINSSNKHDIDKHILKNIGCGNFNCTNCYYYKKHRLKFCALSDERIEYKNCSLDECKKCNYNDCESIDFYYTNEIARFCNYKYLKEQYDKLDLMQKILK